MFSRSGSLRHAALTPLEIVRAFHARLEAGRPLHGLVHERFERVGNPGGALLEANVPLDQSVAAARRQGYSFHVQACEAAPGGRVLARGVWSHDAPRGGSAGLVYAVYETLEGRIVMLRFFEDRDAARAFAGFAA